MGNGDGGDATGGLRGDDGIALLGAGFVENHRYSIERQVPMQGRVCRESGDMTALMLTHLPEWVFSMFACGLRSKPRTEKAHPLIYIKKTARHGHFNGSSIALWYIRYLSTISHL
jgi:hypothetical protein